MDNKAFFETRKRNTIGMRCWQQWWKESIEYCRYYWLSEATKAPIFLSRNDTIIARQNVDILNIRDFFFWQLVRTNWFISWNRKSWMKIERKCPICVQSKVWQIFLMGIPDINRGGINLKYNFASRFLCVIRGNYLLNHIAI